MVFSFSETSCFSAAHNAVTPVADRVFSVSVAPDEYATGPADLPQMEPPSSGGGSGLFGQIKGYSRDGVVLGGLIISAIAFIVVANAAISTFSEIRDGKKSGRSLGPLWWWG